MAPDESDGRVCGACGGSLAAAAGSCAVCGTAAPTPADAPTEAAPPSPAGPSSAGSSLFPPGKLLADRFRIVSLLGRGGMGKVYRAEDLKLGQTVALKFLPQAMARQEAARQRLYQEVRLGRQVSHPNVCRLYDVVEWEGQLFVTMEYIDGEDLASLLRRIGALPPAKVVQLAHEICAGLAAAHGLGVIHRDLKPANIMIDGRGNARITDFGLAVLAEGMPADREMAGTPVYMAPEQLRGDPSSARSDLYALGLVLYEMLRGERLFAASSRPELLRQHQASKASALAASADTAEPALHRVVAHCLEERPEDRPGSIHTVIAALPGGDPLQAALDAGETPSPELVAAAGGSGALRPRTALAALAALVVLLLANALFAVRWGQVPGYIEVPEGPEALATRAADLLQQVGVDTRAGDRDYGWSFDWDRRKWVVENGFEWTGRGRRMAPSPAFLWYRSSPWDLDPVKGTERISERDPPLDRPGMARLRLDAQGRLLSLTVVPPARLPVGIDDETDWGPLLRATGLEEATIEETEPQWTPPVGATGRRAWTATYPDQPDLPVRVESATAAGRAVWLEVIPPWAEAAREGPPEDASRKVWKATLILQGSLFLLLLTVAALLVRRNLRRGRGDRRGAQRLALFAGATTLAHLLARVDFVPAAMLEQTISQLGFAIAQAFVAWIVYLAIEPYLRRSWPRLMVGWHRLLAGRLRDPRVGREVLAGLCAGALLAAVAGELAVALRIAELPHSPPLELLGRFRDVVARVFEALESAAGNPLWAGLVLLLATLLLRRRALAVGGLWLFMFLISGGLIFDLGYALAFKTLVASVTVLVLIRAGMVGIGAMAFAGTLLDLPLTLDPGRWYFVHSLVPLVLLLVVGTWAAWRAMGEQPALAAWLAEERLPS